MHNFVATDLPTTEFSFLDELSESADYLTGSLGLRVALFQYGQDLVIIALSGFNQALTGLGVSSIGNVGRVYVQNSKTLHEYYQSIDAGELAIERGFMSDDRDVLIGRIIQDLMCKFEVDTAAFEERSGLNFRNHFRDLWPRLMRFENEGLLDLEADRIKVTDQGRFLIRSICMTFDDYLSQDSQKFSKAI